MKSLDRIRDYVVWGRLAEGGMGDVWLGRHTGLGVPVVIKTLKSLGAEADQAREQLLTEGRLDARISSPHVARVFDSGTHEGAPFLVQEYVDGLDVRELARGRQESLGRTLPLWAVCEIIAQTATALETAHRVGIVHRDVKPSNILGAGLEFKLADFGLAVDSLALTTQGSGTLSFMAPEAIRGDSTDRCSDIFSLGATAFALRYGYSPFATVASTLSAEPARFPRAPSTEEAAFQDLVGRMLAKAPHERPPDLGHPRRLFVSFAALFRTLVAGSRRHDGSYALRETSFTCEEGDISAQRVDGIVSSANHELKMRHGVGDALRARGGDEIEREAMAGGERLLGDCVVTGAGKLWASHVLHAVCAWQAASCVGRAMQSTLIASERLGLPSLAIPALGTGAAGVSLEASAAAIAAAVRMHVLLAGSRLQRVSFVLYDAQSLRIFRDVFESVFLSDACGPVDAGLPISPMAANSGTAFAPTLGAS